MIDITLLKHIANVSVFKKDALVVVEDDTTIGELFIILKGNAEVYKNYGTEHLVSIASLSTGDMFGEMSLFTGNPRSATIVADTDLTLISITKDNFLDFMQSNPIITMQIIELLCHRITDANKKLEVLTLSLQNRSNETLLIQPPPLTLGERVLFPTGHKRYLGFAHEEFTNYLFEEKMTCPYCGEKFVYQSVFVSRLKVGEPMGCDLRPHFQNFDPIWYSLLTCPHCYFSFLAEYVEKTDQIRLVTGVADELAKIKDAYTFRQSALPALDDVFAAHYLALLCAPSFPLEAKVRARLWLQISYLYHDAQDQPMYLMAVEQSLAYFLSFDQSGQQTPEEDQTNALAIAHLYFELGNMEGAIKYISKLIFNNNALTIYQRIANNKLDDIRLVKKKQKAAEEAAEATQ